MRSFSLFFLVAIISLSFPGCNEKKNSVAIVPGYNKAELTSLIPVMERAYDSADIGGFKTPEPEGIKRVFRSKVSPLMNRFDVWNTSDNKAVIAIRGSIIDPGGLSFTAAFYSPMVPAIGKIKISETKTFEYKLAELPGAAVHLGMLLGLAHISDELLSQIKEQYANGVRDFTLLGHSQGSGIGFLATSYIRYLQKDGQLPTDFRLKTYLIAAPKTGNLQYAYDYQKINNGGWAMAVNNVLDWVPCIGITLQTAVDFPRISPFYDMKSFLASINFPTGPNFDATYNQFLSAGPVITKEILMIIHENVYPRVMKVMPGYVEPVLLGTFDFERSGDLVPLFPDAEYYKVFPQDTVPFQAWKNHSVYPYYLLVKSNY
ncbi:MAG: hypothetical protein WCL00_01265 [Bacteroidota bacterium]